MMKCLWANPEFKPGLPGYSQNVEVAACMVLHYKLNSCVSSMHGELTLLSLSCLK